MAQAGPGLPDSPSRYIFPSGSLPRLPGSAHAGYPLQTGTAADGSELMAERQTALASATSVEPGRATRDALSEMTEAWRAIKPPAGTRMSTTGTPAPAMPTGRGPSDSSDETVTTTWPTRCASASSGTGWPRIVGPSRSWRRTRVLPHPDDPHEEQARSRSRPQAGDEVGSRTRKIERPLTQPKHPHFRVRL